MLIGYFYDKLSTILYPDGRHYADAITERHPFKNWSVTIVGDTGSQKIAQK